MIEILIKLTESSTGTRTVYEAIMRHIDSLDDNLAKHFQSCKEHDLSN